LISDDINFRSVENKNKTNFSSLNLNDLIFVLKNRELKKKYRKQAEKSHFYYLCKV